jgi:lycopene cyclase domain-containing protein
MSAYLFHLLVYALPVLAAQLIGVCFFYRGRLGLLLKAALPPIIGVTAWLVAADHLAISAGIWRFDPHSLLGVKLGAVPLEEVLFFFLTNCLVVFGLALFQRPRLA